MYTTALVLGLVLIAADTESRPRKASAIAPSLRAITREEEEKFDEIVNRFIRADTGGLKGPAARKALQELEALKPEAIPALIRGLNRAARLNATCPVLTIHKKLSKMLLSSNDQVLLEYARDEIGADIGRSWYAGTLRDLRVKLMIRKNALAQLGPARPAVGKGTTAPSTSELVKAASTERGARLKGVIAELSKRNGKEALAGLAVAASSYDRETQKLAHQGLDAVLGRLTATALRDHLGDDNAEVRRSAIRVAAAKHPSLVGAVIDRLTDEVSEVRAEARAALKKISKGEDFGPFIGATRAQQQQAQRKWRDWWDSVKKN
jgi:hypothetical protein